MFRFRLYIFLSIDRMLCFSHSAQFCCIEFQCVLLLVRLTDHLNKMMPVSCPFTFWNKYLIEKYFETLWISLLLILQTFFILIYLLNLIWTYGFLFYLMSFKPLLLFILTLKLSLTWLVEAFSLMIEYDFLILSTSFLSGVRRYFNLIRYFPCSKLGISPFSKESSFPLVKMVFKHQYVGTRCLHCYCHVAAIRWWEIWLSLFCIH